MTQFKPIGKMSVSQAIIDQITDLVERGELKPGEKLPSERQLSEQFQVGRGSVREAMVTLQAMGLVERKNRGTVLCNNEKILDTSALEDISRACMNVKDVLETRILLEGEIAGLAAERAQPEDISKIAASMECQDDFYSYEEMDRNFHTAIAEAAHNSVLCGIYKLTMECLFETHRVYEEMENASPEYVKQVIEEGKESHRKILMEIQKKDKKAARATVEEHLNMAEKRLFSGIGARNLSPSGQ